MATTPTNSINETTIGITGFTGTGFTGSLVTQHAVLVGGATSSTITSLSVAASNTLLQGSTGSDPAFTAYPEVSGLGIGASPGSTSGLTFDGTNFLDIYQTGTWTPNFQINSSSTGITYTTQQGGYTKIGNSVIFWISITLSSKGASTGNLSISNFPFATAGSGGQITTSIAQFNQYTHANYTSLGINFSSSSTVAQLVRSGSGVNAQFMTDADITNTFSFQTTGSYFTV